MTDLEQNGLRNLFSKTMRNLRAGGTSVQGPGKPERTEIHEGTARGKPLSSAHSQGFTERLGAALEGSIRKSKDPLTVLFPNLQKQHQPHSRQDGNELDEGPGGFDIPVKLGHQVAPRDIDEASRREGKRTWINPATSPPAHQAASPPGSPSRLSRNSGKWPSVSRTPTSPGCRNC